MIQKGTNVLSEHAKKRLDFKPELKQINFLDRRVYQRSEGVYYPSVTSILQHMPKNKFFESWIKDVGHNADIIMRRAGDEGTQTHNAIEELLQGKEITWMDDYGNARYNELVWGMIIKFKEFWQATNPELIFTEEFTYSDTHKYAGTADIVVKMNNETWLIDYQGGREGPVLYDLVSILYQASAQLSASLQNELKTYYKAVLP